MQQAYCPVCGEKFTESKKLRKHLQKKHFNEFSTDDRLK